MGFFSTMRLSFLMFSDALLQLLAEEKVLQEYGAPLEFFDTLQLVADIFQTKFHSSFRDFEDFCWGKPFSKP